MALIRQDSGCKVGWLTFDNEDEAKAAAATAKVDARGMARRGYDFGYQFPGSITQGRRYTTVRADGSPDTSGPFELIPEWTVVTP